jgi:hypothetical protein
VWASDPVSGAGLLFFFKKKIGNNLVLIYLDRIEKITI